MEPGIMFGAPAPRRRIDISYRDNQAGIFPVLAVRARDGFGGPDSEELLARGIV